MDMGRAAYEAYVVSCGGRSVRGEPLPPWERQAPEIREHWRAAADAVLMLSDLRSADDTEVHGHRAYRAHAGVTGDSRLWEDLSPEVRGAWRAAAAAARYEAP
jgi:hypothetical protein